MSHILIPPLNTAQELHRAYRPWRSNLARHHNLLDTKIRPGASHSEPPKRMQTSLKVKSNMDDVSYCTGNSMECVCYSLGRIWRVQAETQWHGWCMISRTWTVQNKTTKHALSVACNVTATVYGNTGTALTSHPVAWSVCLGFAPQQFWELCIMSETFAPPN